MGIFDGLGATVQNIGDKAMDLYTSSQENQTELEIARLNANAATTQTVVTEQSKSWLYLGIGVLGAAYLLFQLRKMEG